MSSPLASSDEEGSEYRYNSDTTDFTDEFSDGGESSSLNDSSDVNENSEDTHTASELVRHDGSDLPWPAADTFTDDSIGLAFSPHAQNLDRSAFDW
jgi:hypothetical protein